MSRTYRRKNYEDTQGTSWDRHGRKIGGYYTYYDYINYWRECADGYYRRGYSEYRPMTEDEANWQWLRDHGETNSHWRRDNPGPWLRRNLQKRQRQKARQEISKFLKHEEYEPIIESRRDKSWWYWL
jgi:hypothetical protein